MTNLLVLRKPTYPQSFMLIYGFLFELWVLNLKEEKKKKMKNSAHHSPIHLWWGGPWPSLYTKHYCALWLGVILPHCWLYNEVQFTFASSLCFFQVINSFPYAFEPARYAVLYKIFRAPLKTSRGTHPKLEPGSSSSVGHACNIIPSAANHWGISFYSWPCHPSRSSTQAGLPTVHLPVSGSGFYPSGGLSQDTITTIKSLWPGHWLAIWLP